MALPLANLLTKDDPFVIDESYMKAFEKLRFLLMSAPIVLLILLLELFWVKG